MVRYDPEHDSDDVVDRRGRRGRGLPAGSGRLVSGILALVGRRFGIVGVVVTIAVLAIGFVVLQPDLPSPSGPKTTRDGPPDESEAFVGFVLDDVQDTWQEQLRGYSRAKLVLYRDLTSTACGLGQAAAGPFYCPADRQVYIDLGFFDALSRMGGTGDFARAYVIAHEVGHHIQNQANLLGRAQGPDAVGPAGNAVRVELQADCLAGVWAASANERGLLEVGDIEEGINAAAAVGDDRLQEQSGGRVRPESFTHGTSEQRARWFARGLQNGTTNACDTFAARTL